jgi:hypothetical protein
VNESTDAPGHDPLALSDTRLEHVYRIHILFQAGLHPCFLLQMQGMTILDIQFNGYGDDIMGKQPIPHGSIQHGGNDAAVGYSGISLCRTVQLETARQTAILIQIKI